MAADPSPSTSRASGFRTGLRVTAVLVFLGCAGFWAAQGAHRGWSQNQVPVKQTDAVTGIEYVTYEKRFVPGVEFLGGGVGLATALCLVSLFFHRKTTNPSP